MAGDEKAQFRLGCAFENGDGVDQSERDAVYWYRKAADQGHPGAQFCLALCYESGVGVRKSGLLSVHWLRLAAEGGDPDAQFKLAEKYEAGCGVGQSADDARSWYQRAAAGGHLVAGDRLEPARAARRDERSFPADKRRGPLEEESAEVLFERANRLVAEGGGAAAESQALALYRKSAGLGNPGAQYVLGVRHLRGHGVSRDESESTAWFQRAAALGHMDAQYRLALALENGFGAIIDEEAAEVWYSKAALQGHRLARAAHERLRGARSNAPALAAPSDTQTPQAESGPDALRPAEELSADPALPRVPPETDEARFLVAEAQLRIALQLSSGIGVTQDTSAAARWLTAAAERGHPAAQRRLAMAYEAGEGVERSRSTALSWYQRAAAQGDVESEVVLGVLSADLLAVAPVAPAASIESNDPAPARRSESEPLQETGAGSVPAPAPKPQPTSDPPTAAPATSGQAPGDQYKLVVDALGASKGAAVVLVSGEAGTGKSHLIDALRRHLRGNVVVLAPTGVAALNVGGETIHRFFGFPPRIITDDDIGRIASDRKFSHLDVLIIDEVSMVRPDILDAIDKVLRKARRHERLPFGGIQLLLVGDPLQLAPVPEPDEEANRWFNQRYRSPHFFEAAALASVPIRSVRLRTVHRQDDERFLEILRQVRAGRVDPSSLADLNGRVDARGHDGLGIVLCATNEQVRVINDARLASLPRGASRFRGRREGSFPDDSLPCPMELELKVGARVMFTLNDLNGRWVNGSIGEVSALVEDSVTVLLGSGLLVAVEPCTWEHYAYVLDDKTGVLAPRVSGRFTQLPLALAWAVTIHKSQGKTFGAAHIHLDKDQSLRAPGQFYVALSRCRRRADVSLGRRVTPEDFPPPSPRVMALWNAITARSGEAATLTLSELLPTSTGAAEASVVAPPHTAARSSVDIRRLVSSTLGGRGRLRISYVDGKGDRSVRVIQPLEWGNPSQLRLVARCELRGGEEREFVVGRIQWAAPAGAAGS